VAVALDECRRSSASARSWTSRVAVAAARRPPGRPAAQGRLDPDAEAGCHVHDRAARSRRAGRSIASQRSGPRAAPAAARFSSPRPGSKSRAGNAAAVQHQEVPGQHSSGSSRNERWLTAPDTRSRSRAARRRAAGGALARSAPGADRNRRRRSSGLSRSRLLWRPRSVSREPNPKQLLRGAGRLRWQVQSEMLVGRRSRYDRGRAVEEAVLQKVRLVDVLDRVRLPLIGRREALISDRPSTELLDDREQQPAVDVVEPVPVDLSRPSASRATLALIVPSRPNLCEVPTRRQQAVRHAGRAAAAPGDLLRALGVDRTPRSRAERSRIRWGALGVEVERCTIPKRAAAEAR